MDIGILVTIVIFVLIIYITRDKTSVSDKAAIRENREYNSQNNTTETRNWFLNMLWPKLSDLDSANHAADIGYFAAMIIAVISVVLSTIALIMSFDRLILELVSVWVFFVVGYGYVKAAVFFLIAWRIKKYSRVFSIIGLALHVIDVPDSNIYLGIYLFTLFMFISGVRGVFAYHNFSKFYPARTITQKPIK